MCVVPFSYHLFIGHQLPSIITIGQMKHGKNLPQVNNVQPVANYENVHWVVLEGQVVSADDAGKERRNHRRYYHCKGGHYYRFKIFQVAAKGLM